LSAAHGHKWYDIELFYGQNAQSHFAADINIQINEHSSRIKIYEDYNRSQTGSTSRMDTHAS